jgi:hypothetical protein
MEAVYLLENVVSTYQTTSYQKSEARASNVGYNFLLILHASGSHSVWMLQY